MRISNCFHNRIKTSKEDNNGSVLVTVLVAFLFVSVLVTMVLASAAVNFRMRAVDRRVKDEFYYAEKGLNDIYTGIGIKSSEIMGKSYNKVLSNENGAFGYNIENEVEAIKRFNKIFADELKPEITKSTLSKFIVDKRATLDSNPEVYFRYIDTSGTYQDVQNLEPSFDYSKFIAIVIKNVTVTSKNPETDYVSAVTSDIVINSPMIDFITVNKRELEYALIANDGIFVDGTTNVSGNVYGGELTSSAISNTNYGGINVNNSKLTLHSRYIISGGNINVNGDSGSLVINNGTECDVWYENMNIYSTNPQALDAKANLYALDDLAVYGDGAGVKLVGDYYGYNDGTLKLKEKDYVVDRLNAANLVPVDKENDSSSLLVNARNATVDMRGVDTFVMLGKAYVNHTSKQSETPPVVFDMDAEYRNIATSESVASKAQQELYLVPGEFLNIPNPAEIKTIDPFTVSIPDNWFGKQYLDETNPSKTIIVKRGAVSYAYCYLNFKDDASRTEYLMRIVPHVDVRVWNTSQMVGYDTSDEATAVSPTPEDIYKRLVAIDGIQGSSIYIGEDYSMNNNKTDEDDIHIYSPYGIVQNTVAVAADGESYSVMLKTNDLGVERFADYKVNMYNKYRWFDAYLDPQEQRSLTTFNKDDTSVNNYNWSFNTVTDEDMDNKGLPLSRLIWIGDGSYYDGARNLGGIGHLSSGTYTDPSIDPDDAEAVKNSLPGKVIVSKGSYTLSDSIDGFVIVDGDVTVNNGVKVNGFIFATGKITFKGNNEVKFNSALLEQRIEKETDRVKNDLRNGVSNPYKEYYLISYLLNINAKSTGISAITDNPIRLDPATGKATWAYLKYNYGNEADEQTSAGINTDYRNYVVYENWKKGQIQ